MRKTLIIAEAGENHNGSMELAYKLIDVAKEAGADIVKFQTSINSISRYAEKAEYQKKTTDASESQLDMTNRLRLGFENYKKLKLYCEKVGIEFLSTPFDVESVRYLSSIDVNYWKIPSGDILNIPLIEEMCKTPKPVILSTGMSTLDELEIPLNILRNGGIKDITMLQCTTEYPAPYESANLMAMKALGEKFNVPFGVSDHTPGIEVPIAAVALGATVVEKHFTLDKNMEGPDHKASLDPNELKAMVQAIRNTEKALGDGIKTVQECEKKNIAVARKSIVANRDIKKGEIFTVDNITTKRPGTGISSVKWHEWLGKTAWRDFENDELIDEPKMN